MSKITNRRFEIAAAMLGAFFLARVVHAAGDMGDQTSLPSVDRQIAAAAERIASLKKLVDEAPLEKNRCRASFSIDAMLKDSANASGFGVDYARNLAMYQVCRGILAGSPAACGDAMGASGGRSCQTAYWHAIESKVLITAATDPIGANRTCLLMRTEDDDARRDHVDPRAFCEVEVHEAGDVRAWASKMAPLFGMRSDSDKMRAQEIVQRVRMGLIEPKFCQDQKDWLEQQSCAAARGYRTAYAHKTPSLCGKSGLCLALMGRRDGCGIYADRLGDAFCAHEDRKKAISAALAETQGKLLNLIRILDGSQGQGGVSERRRRVVGLLKRVNSLSKISMDVNAGPKGAASNKGR